MTRFLIEREIDGANDLTQDDLAKIAQTSNDAVASLGVPYTWVNSYVAGDKTRDDSGARAPRRIPRQPGVGGRQRVRPADR